MMSEFEEMMNNRIKRLDKSLEQLKKKRDEIDKMITQIELKRAEKNQDIDSWLISTISGDLYLIDRLKKPGEVSRYDKVRYDILKVDLDRLWDFVHNFTNRYDSIQDEFDYLQNEIEFNLNHEEFEKAEENSRKLIDLCESIMIKENN